MGKAPASPGGNFIQSEDTVPTLKLDEVIGHGESRCIKQAPLIAVHMT